MGLATVVLFYGSVVFCLIGLIVEVAKNVKAPVHLHWDLYRKGSVYELTKWWTRPHRCFVDKLKHALLDVLLFKEFYRRKRSFWVVLQIFHLGLYALIGWHAWLFVFSRSVDVQNPPGWGLTWGHTATAMVFIGAAGILLERIIDKELRVDYGMIHYAKWVFLIVCLAGGFYAVHFHFNGNILSVMRYVNEQMAFEIQSKLNAPAATSAHLLIAAPWLIYLPFSHIVKLALKYYHHFRWDEKPNLRGSAVEKRINDVLEQPVSWSAPHIQTGKKWREVVQDIPLNPNE